MQQPATKHEVPANLPEPVAATPFIAAALLLCLWSLILITLQIFYWLKNGQWFELPAYLLFVDHRLLSDPPAVLSVVPSFPVQESLGRLMYEGSWKGLGRILVWILEQSLAALAFGIAWVCWGIAAILD